MACHSFALWGICPFSLVIHSWTYNGQLTSWTPSDSHRIKKRTLSRSKSVTSSKSRLGRGLHFSISACNSASPSACKRPLNFRLIDDLPLDRLSMRSILSGYQKRAHLRSLCWMQSDGLLRPAADWQDS